MLRSMLYVRNGSGCSRWQTSCAARPRSSSPACWNRETPSSKASRVPSTARCKISPTVEDKVDSFRGQSHPGGHLGEPSEPGELRLAKFERQRSGQVIVAGCDIESQPRTVNPCEFLGVGQALGPAACQCPRKVFQVDASPRDPEGKDKGQVRQLSPGFRQVHHLVERLVWYGHCPIADH